MRVVVEGVGGWTDSMTMAKQKLIREEEEKGREQAGRNSYLHDAAVSPRASETRLRPRSWPVTRRSMARGQVTPSDSRAYTVPLSFVYTF